MKDFLFPAVDIKGGKAVRLVQGDANRLKVFDESPVQAARKWAAFGFTHLHVVDLDGAFSGQEAVGDVLKTIVDETGMKVEIGGGIRSIEAATRCLARGAWRVIVGTLALEQPEILESMLELHGPDKIVVGVDAKEGFVAGRGWVDVSKKKDTDFVQELAALGVATVIYTDIGRDGMLSEPAFERYEELAGLEVVDLIASGGIASLDQVKRLKALHPRIKGSIVGMALYEGRIDPVEAALC